jgi:hypothetical protein
VAAQSYQALEQLHQLKNDDANSAPADSNVTTKIVIPFFGTISVQRGQNYRQQPIPSSTSQNTPHSQSLNTPATPDYAKVTDQAAAAYSSMDPQVMFDGLYQFPTSFATSLDPQLAPADDQPGIGGFATSNNGGFWPSNWGQMDLDQDWSWLMNDNAAQTGVPFGMSG